MDDDVADEVFAGVVRAAGVAEGVSMVEVGKMEVDGVGGEIECTVVGSRMGREGRVICRFCRVLCSEGEPMKNSDTTNVTVKKKMKGLADSFKLCIFQISFFQPRVAYISWGADVEPDPLAETHNPSGNFRIDSKGAIILT